MRRFYTTILFSILLTGTISAIEVSGDIWGTWSPENNPYEIVGQAHVPHESTLMILPGCYIEFQNYCRIEIDTMAVFQAIGAIDDSIYFVSPDTSIIWNALDFYNADSNSFLAYCVIDGGFGSYSGALTINNTSMTIANCFIKNCEGFIGGAGIYLKHSNIIINSTKLYNNNTAIYGGGIYCDSSTLTVSNCVIDSNRSHLTTYVYTYGGGICCQYSDVTIRDNLFVNNMCHYQGGAICLQHCTGLITNNIISNNVSKSIGGGIAIGYDSDVEISYNLITSNEARYSGVGSGGGGIYLGDSTQAEIFNNTICNNYARGDGGGVLAHFDDDKFFYNIIWGNTAYYGDDQITLSDESDSSIIIYCDIEGDWPGDTNIDADPLFCDSTNGDYYLAANSPCIGSGYEGDNIGIYGIGCEPTSMDDYASLPEGFQLLQNYPNPFNESTAIKFELPNQSFVTIDIYDILGRKITTLINGNQSAGSHQLIWYAGDISSGVYFYKIQANGYNEMRKMILLK